MHRHRRYVFSAPEDAAALAMTCFVHFRDGLNVTMPDRFTVDLAADHDLSETSERCDRMAQTAATSGIVFVRDSSGWRRVARGGAETMHL